MFENEKNFGNIHEKAKGKRLGRKVGQNFSCCIRCIRKDKLQMQFSDLYNRILGKRGDE